MNVPGLVSGRSVAAGHRGRTVTAVFEFRSAVVVVLSCLSCAAFVPAVVRVIRTRCAVGLSPAAEAIATVECAVWVIYAAWARDVGVAASSAVGLVGSAVLLALTVTFGARDVLVRTCGVFAVTAAAAVGVVAGGRGVVEPVLAVVAIVQMSPAAVVAVRCLISRTRAVAVARSAVAVRFVVAVGWLWYSLTALVVPVPLAVWASGSVLLQVLLFSAASVGRVVPVSLRRTGPTVEAQVRRASFQLPLGYSVNR